MKTNLNIEELFILLKQENFAANSIYLEWNIYRAFYKLGNYISIKPNFKMDNNNYPLSHAKSGCEDISIEYISFSLLLEASLTSGKLQLDREAESVVRHITNFKDKNCYSLFICNNISLDFTKYIGITKKHFKIIPITIDQLLIIYKKYENNFSPEDFKKLLEKLLFANIPFNQPKLWLTSINQAILEL